MHIITSLNDGGAEAVLYRLCEHDVQSKKIVVCLSGVGKYSSLLEKLNIEVYSLNMSPIRPSVLALFKLVSILRSYKPNLIQTWMYHGNFFGSLGAIIAGSKNIVWGIHHTNLEPCKTKRATIWIAKVLAKLSWKLPSKIVLCAERAFEVHESLGFDGSKIRVIPNGYDPRQFLPDDGRRIRIRRELELSNDVVLIGCVGRFNPEKDHGNLLRALKQIKMRRIAFKCVFIGTNMDLNNRDLTSQIEALELSKEVILLGSRTDIPSIMNAIDLHVLPSSGEAFPNVVAEAMLCGTPCVVTDVGDAAYIVGKTGWVVPPRNSTALAAAINDAIHEMTLASWVFRKVNARQRILTNFSIDRMVTNYRELWMEVINTQPSRTE